MLTLGVLGRRVRRVERWALIRCLRLLSASLWLLHASVDFLLISAVEMDFPPSRLVGLIKEELVGIGILGLYPV